MIRIEGLHKGFLDGDTPVTILRDLALEIPAGEFVALHGRSGSGKSTLLNCIAGLEPVDAGTIHLGDTPITGLSDHALTQLRRDRIGIVFQMFHLLPVLSIRENVALPALLRGDRRAKALPRADALLEELGLGGRGHELPEHLSGGEQQRVATARALINEPDLLLADEPTGSLDLDNARRTLLLLREVNERHGVTVLMATHSREAARIADRVATLRDGQVEMTEPVDKEPPPPPAEPPEAAAADSTPEEPPPVAPEPDEEKASKKAPAAGIVAGGSVKLNAELAKELAGNDPLAREVDAAIEALDVEESGGRPAVAEADGDEGPAAPVEGDAADSQEGERDEPSTEEEPSEPDEPRP